MCTRGSRVAGSPEAESPAGTAASNSAPRQAPRPELRSARPPACLLSGHAVRQSRRATGARRWGSRAPFVCTVAARAAPRSPARPGPRSPSPRRGSAASRHWVSRGCRRRSRPHRRRRPRRGEGPPGHRRGESRESRLKMSGCTGRNRPPRRRSPSSLGAQLAARAEDEHLHRADGEPEPVGDLRVRNPRPPAGRSLRAGSAAASQAHPSARGRRDRSDESSRASGSTRRSRPRRPAAAGSGRGSRSGRSRRARISARAGAFVRRAR